MLDMRFRTHLPEDEYLRRIGLVVYMVASVEGLLLFDLSRLADTLPPQLTAESLAGSTTARIGQALLAHAPLCSDPAVVSYLTAGGHALLEIGSNRNAVMHARPATDLDGRTRLYRWRLPEAHVIEDAWLDQLARRIDQLQVELNSLRPPVVST